jgi:hypothetical protein
VPGEFVEDGGEPERDLLTLEASELGLDAVVAQEPGGLVDERLIGLDGFPAAALLLLGHVCSPRCLGLAGRARGEVEPVQPAPGEGSIAIAAASDTAIRCS